ncbi:Macrocin O-methyltransferase [Phaeobacter sp. CECT 5382]|uniref:TylF/MycF family methyltransferase n=1 Tax=Phaeobacter sp. CECT 5382 TaxID=1712645 RepID=UPI0006DAAFD9|nr:TylF/MycF family methyltransferase [Phaeobacter sp. CECT 5382]CUH89609.1 Macrocin O-methyltransferase [Phaeobacter sp. CECT 5382]
MLDTSPQANSLYLDLMEKCLANTIYGDDPTDPWTGKKYHVALRENGKDWPSKAHTMIGAKRLRNTREMAEAAIKEGIPGDFIETGVWRGGASIMMRAVCKAYGDTSRQVYVADSFEGLPPADPTNFPADTGDVHDTYEELAVSQEQVSANFASYGLLDDQVKFLKGWFKDTLPGLDRTFAVVRLDGDMYESTIQAIEALYPRLSPGGFLIVDDYGAVPGCKQAIEDYRAANNITAQIFGIDWTGVWWRKPHE